MKKNKKVVILLIIFVLIISGFIFMKTWKKTYTKANYNIASVQEKEKLDFFYDGSIPISKGKYFDIRYLYYNDKSPTKIKLDVVKKVEEDIKIDEMIIYNSNGEEILIMLEALNVEFHKKQTKEPNIFMTFKNYNYYGILNGYNLFRGDRGYLTPDEEYRNLQKLTIELKIDGAIEKHELVFDKKESLNTLAQVNEWKHDTGQETRRYYLSYYYGLLMKEDFEQWKQNVNMLLNDEYAKDYDWSNIFDLPNSIYLETYKVEQLQGYLNLSDEEFEQYLLFLKTTVEKELIDKVYLNS